MKFPPHLVVHIINERLPKFKENLKQQKQQNLSQRVPSWRSHIVVFCYPLRFAHPKISDGFGNWFSAAVTSAASYTISVYCSSANSVQASLSWRVWSDHQGRPCRARALCVRKAYYIRLISNLVVFQSICDILKFAKSRNSSPLFYRASYKIKGKSYFQ